ncbi:MAG: hypothetical protein DWQ02_21155 [Bacteroidetes bacterium]|nr:MAG: hypothetical protein DWQ02_21155 [Bacteroidota bacterium]
MKKMPTLKEFLYQAGVNKDTPPDKVQLLKKQYRKAYQKWYQLKRKKDTLRYTLRFSKTEFSELKRVATRYTSTDTPTITKKAKLAPFIKKAVLAYLSNQYLPRDEKLVRELGKDIRAIGNNINQLTQRIHQLRRSNQQSGNLSDDEFNALYTNYFALQNHIIDLESRINKFMHQPTKTLKQALEESLLDRPNKIDQLVDYLLTLKNQDNAGSEK